MQLASSLQKALGSFVDYYNHHRYHEALRDVTPADVYHGRQEEILARRRESKQHTVEARRRFNQRVGASEDGPSLG